MRQTRWKSSYAMAHVCLETAKLDNKKNYEKPVFLTKLEVEG
jgi:hypothetical protein